MTGALLRSGTLKDFEPLGALGNPVYLAAPQLRAAIGRRLGGEAAGILAIPHRNQDGDTIDWYAQRSGPVVPWSAATPEERAGAKEQLLAVRERIDKLRETMQGEEGGERQVFARLLEHVTSFPDDGHVYLVDGQAVITFWGFRHQDTPVDSIQLLNLDLAQEAPPPAANRGRSLWWWLLPLLLLLAVVLFFLLRGCAEEPSPGEPGADPQEAVPIPGKPEPPVEPEAVQHEEPGGPGPAAEPVQRDVLLRDGETRVIGSDRMGTDATTVVDETLVADPAAAGVVDGAMGVTEGEVSGPGEIADQIPGADAAPIAETPGGDLEANGLDTGAADPDAIEPSAPEAGMEAGEPADERPAGDASAEGESAADEPAAEQAGEAPVPDEVPEGSSRTGEDPADPADPAEPISAPAPGEAPESARQGREDGAPAPNTPAGAAGSADGGTPGARPSARPPGPADARAARFLNGGWRTSTSLQDPRTALPVDMEYRLEDGAGRLTLKRSDGSVCSGQVKAVVEDGRLVVQNARDIRCPDGTNFGRPRLECVPGADGRADCSGRYETGEVFSVDIKQSDEPRRTGSAAEAADPETEKER